MSRLSREQKRESKRQRSAVGPGAGPLEVWVTAPAGESGGGVTVGGVPVGVMPGETVQATVLNHLHRLALAAGHSVLAPSTTNGSASSYRWRCTGTGRAGTRVSRYGWGRRPRCPGCLQPLPRCPRLLP